MAFIHRGAGSVAADAGIGRAISHRGPRLGPNLGCQRAVADVVHVVRESAKCAPQKTHAPLTNMVNLGSLWTVENAHRAASIGEYAGSRIAPNDLAKVGVAGSNPVVRSKRITRSGHCEGSKSAPRGASGRADSPQLHHIFSNDLSNRMVDPDILHVMVRPDQW